MVEEMTARVRDGTRLACNNLHRPDDSRCGAKA